MRVCFIAVPALLLAGCAHKAKTVRAPAREVSPVAAIPERPATRLVETRYEMRGYHDANDPTVRHERHAVYRATRVPIRADDSVDTLVTVPRTAFQPATHAPLSQNAELGAELTTQKQITAELRSIQAAMTATQKNAEEKFGELVNQTAETIKLRRELEEERARVRQLEASLRDRSSEAAVPTSATVASDMKW
jgi:hypothetical protein